MSCGKRWKWYFKDPKFKHFLGEGGGGGGEREIKGKRPRTLPISPAPNPLHLSTPATQTIFSIFFREREGDGENNYQVDNTAEINNVHVLKHGNIISWNSSLLVKLLKVYWSLIMGNQRINLAYGRMLNHARVLISSNWVRLILCTDHQGS